MKKFLSLLILGVLILSVSVVTCAEGNFKVYGDYMVSGNYNYSDNIGNRSSDSLSLLLIGGQYSADKFKVVGEISALGELGNGCKLNIVDIKGGYCLFQNETSKFDFTGGYLTISYSYSNAVYSGLMLGADGSLVISDAAVIEGTFGIGLANNFTRPGYANPNSVGLIDYKIKVNFIISENMAISGGYRGYIMSRDYSGFVPIEVISGLTLGASFKI